MNEFQEFYRVNRINYYDNKKETKTATIQYINNLNYTLKSALIEKYEDANVWKEFDFLIYSVLIKGMEFNADIAKVTWHIIKALGTKEFVIVAMDIFECLCEQIDLNLFIAQFFAYYKNVQLDMSYYAYLLPSIKKCYGDRGLALVEESTDIYLYKLHAMRFYHRFPYTIFIRLNGAYLNSAERELLFELICRRHEKTLEYESAEVDFILKHVVDCDAAFMHLKYFLSHVCVCANRTNRVNGAIFKTLERVWLAAFNTEDGDVVRKGVLMLKDVYNCLANSDYKTLYTLTEGETFKPMQSPVFRMLHLSQKFTINATAAVVNLLVKNMNKKYAYLINEAILPFGFGLTISESEIHKFIGNPDPDFMDGRVESFIESVLLRPEMKREALVESTLPMFASLFQCEITTVNCAIFRCFKLAHRLVENVDDNERILYEAVSIKLIEYFTDNGGVAIIDKLCERLLVCAIELLVSLNLGLSADNSMRLGIVFRNLKRCIYCNRRYVVSTTATLYRKFISSNFENHRELLLKSVESIIGNTLSMASSSSNMRKSLEERTLVHEFCLGVPRALQNEITLRIADKTMLYLQSDLFDKRPYIYTMNALMEDATLKQHTHQYVLPLFKICIQEIDKCPECFSMRNAIYALFATLVMRTLPYEDNSKNKSFDDLYTIYGQTMDNFLASFDDETSMTKRQRTLLMIMLKRSNSEQPKGFILTTASSKCRETLWRYFKNLARNNEICDAECAIAIELWISIIPESQVQSILNALVKSDEFEQFGFNALLFKFKILEALLQKLEQINERKVLLRNLKDAMDAHSILGSVPDELAAVPPPCVRTIHTKGWTYDKALEVVCNVTSRLSEKLAAFEFLFQHYTEEERIKDFMNTFFFPYLQLLLYITIDYFPLVSYFINSINIMVYCFDNFKDTEYPILTLPADGLLMSTVAEFTKYPSVLAFRLMLLGRIDFFGEPSRMKYNTDIPNALFNTFDKCHLKRQLTRTYYIYAGRLDNMHIDDAQSMLIAFKHMNYMVGPRHVFVLYMIALRFLHSELMKTYQYFVPLVLRAFNVFRITCAGTNLTAPQAIRYLLSDTFTEIFFPCHTRRADARTAYLQWRDKDPRLSSFLNEDAST